MSQFSFETQGTNTFLVYGVSSDEAIDTMSLGMITNNHIPGLAPTIYTQMDTQKFIKFNVSAKISVNQFFSGYVNRKRLLGVFEGVVNAMLAAEDYMIDENSILLDLDYIFADVSTCETVLVCLPIVNDDLSANVDLGAFFKNIMFNTQFDQTENCDYVAKIINYLNSTPVFSLSEFKSILDTLMNNTSIPAQQAVAQPTPAPRTVSAAPQVTQVTPTVQPVTAPQPAPVKPVQPSPIVPPQTVTQSVPPVNVPPADKPQKKHSFGSKKEKQPDSINVPGSVQPAQVKTDETQSSEKPMSVLYLLQHYNKENAAIYKAQKEAKNSGKTAKSAKQEKSASTKGTKSASFAVPGAPSNVGFAIPGQNVSINDKTNVAAAQPQTPNAVKPNASAFVAVNQGARPVDTPIVQPVTATPVSQPVVTQTTVPANFGETTVLGGGNIGETTVLGAVSNEPKVAMPYLIRQKNNEKISINKPVFRIGKERSYVDYFIGDNSAISRSHANIVTKDNGEYCVVDTNSTNHTYVDDVMIQSNIEVKIVSGNKIKLGNEIFEFVLI